MNNIIVYGIKRTGTSLMMEMVGKSGEYTIHKDEKLENSPFYKDVQDYYNEGIFTGGVTKENIAEYKKLKNHAIKIMHRGISNTDIDIIKDFRKIIFMNRYWVSQSISSTKMSVNVARENHEKIKHKIDSLEEYFSDVRIDDGVEYAYHYSTFILDLVKRGYQEKLIVVNFEELLSNPESTIKFLAGEGIDIKPGESLISKKQTKNGIIDKNTLKEFHPGFFDFLDKLYICIRDGNIGNEILDLIKKWIPLLTTNIKEREIRVYNKYQIIFSEWMEKEIERLEKLEKSNP